MRCPIVCEGHPSNPYGPKNQYFNPFRVRLLSESQLKSLRCALLNGIRGIVLLFRALEHIGKIYEIIDFVSSEYLYSPMNCVQKIMSYLLCSYLSKVWGQYVTFNRPHVGYIICLIWPDTVFPISYFLSAGLTVLYYKDDASFSYPTSDSVSNACIKKYGTIASSKKV